MYGGDVLVPKIANFRPISSKSQAHLRQISMKSEIAISNIPDTAYHRSRNTLKVPSKVESKKREIKQQSKLTFVTSE
jgi:hypothetical protein